MSFGALSTASRFAVLKLEEEGDRPMKRPKPPTKTNDKITSGDKSKLQASKKVEKDTARALENELRSLAFGAKIKKKPQSNAKVTTTAPEKVKLEPPKTPQVQTSKKKTPNEVPKRVVDVETIAFEQDLQEAILLSKIDFEEKREHYKAAAQESESAKATSKQKKKAKKDTATMSLVDFSKSVGPTTNGIAKDSAKINGTLNKREKMQQRPPEANFFDQVKTDTKKELQRENRKRAMAVEESKLPVDVRLLQLQDTLERMKKENDKLQGEIADLKKMNSKLCSLLSDGKNKGKVDALLQAEEHNSVKDELTQEIAVLTVALEQERSKNHGLQEKLLKYQGSRKDSH